MNFRSGPTSLSGIGTVHSTLASISGNATLWLGKRGGGTPNYLTGKIAEVLVFDGVLSADNEYRMLQYLTDRYGKEILGL